MASIATFKCQKCDREFKLQFGLLQKDLMGVSEGEDLSGGGKLPDKETFRKLSEEKTSGKTNTFINELIEHRKGCDGDVKYIKAVFAH